MGVAVLDVWTGHITSDQSTKLIDRSYHISVAALIAVAACTANSLRRHGEAGEIILFARARLEGAVAMIEDWQELWALYSELGKRTGFRLGVEARCTVRLWLALFNFAVPNGAHTVRAGGLVTFVINIPSRSSTCSTSTRSGSMTRAPREQGQGAERTEAFPELGCDTSRRSLGAAVGIIKARDYGIHPPTLTRRPSSPRDLRGASS